MMRVETMGPHFDKLRFEVGAFSVCLHHLRAPDVGDPHDHPFAFTTTILAGGYVEEIWTRDGRGWSSTFVHRLPGTSHLVEASTIHRIVALPEGECLTSVVWHDVGVQREQPRFFRLVDGVLWSRRWNEPEFSLSYHP